MTLIDVPAADSKLDIEIKGMPIRLWWSLLEAAQLQKVPLNYFIFRTLTEAVNFGADGEGYDLVVQEIKKNLRPRTNSPSPGPPGPRLDRRWVAP